ncbi:ATP-dependent helicase [Pseudomonas syringae]|uniref:ATP-dependent helicase n=1 Tax=Pseudomonas syringae TaxID=317 RepID=UPI002466BD84|nr:ATP-dependent helicase [Pseudomonas syringae]MDH4602472.1 ATP-dependent helicase [Pseudomonas syringae pv. papulans]
MLSQEQQLIVHHPDDKHGLVLAVAGSGKSTTMGERIAWLIEAKRYSPEHVIAVMFNTGAAKELGEKLERRLGKRNKPESITYHRLGTLTLRRLAKEGKAEAWPLEGDPFKTQRFATQVIYNVCMDNGHKYPRIVADVFLSFIDRVKSDLVPPAKVFSDGDWDSKYHWFVKMFDVFEKARIAKKIRFLPDLIYDPVMIMMNDPEAAEIVADRYEHIIVDEYQDICESQQALLRFNAGRKARVMVVGDDDQTIYTWRGAKPSYILRDFQRDFPGALTYKLTRTWRYGHTLSCAANYLISGNLDRADKLCISGEKAPDTQIHLEWEWAFDDAGKRIGSSGSKVLEIVTNHLEKGGKLSDVAVLVRAFSKSAAAQYALLQTGVPFRLEGGENASVLENPWVNALIGWMGVVSGDVAHRPYAGEPDPGSIINLRKILDVPHIGLTWEGTNKLITEVLKRPDGIEGFSEFVTVNLHVKDGGLAQKIYERGQIWRSVRALVGNENVTPFDLLSSLVERLEIAKGISKQANSEDIAEENWALVQAFLSYVEMNSQGRSLREFLRHLNDLRSFSDRAKSSTDAIHITSIHRSKGLEFRCVIMVGLSQGAFPLKPKKALLDEKADRHLEDERRLFYVGMTRAIHDLWLLSPPDAALFQSMRAGKSGVPEGELAEDGSAPSQFLFELNLFLSRTMPTMLQRGIQLEAADPEIYNAYLEACGVSKRVGKINSV